LFERFTEKAIKVIMLAQEESRRLGHNFVGTEVVLLGLIGEATGMAAQTLKGAGLNLKDARVEVENVLGRGTGFVAVEIPFTVACKRLLEFSWNEARQLGSKFIDTQHLLLGLIDCDEGLAGDILTVLGVDPLRLRRAIILALSDDSPKLSSSRTPPSPVAPPSPVPTFTQIEENLRRILTDLRFAEASAIALSNSDLAKLLDRYEGQLTKQFGKLGFNLEQKDRSEKLEQSRKALLGAQIEARGLGHDSIGTEFLLLGILVEGASDSAEFLHLLGVTLQNARFEVEKIIGIGLGGGIAEIPYTPRAKIVIDLAEEIAEQLGHKQVVTEHILLALLREREGTAIRVLKNLGLGKHLKRLENLLQKELQTG